ncbi:MAG TPA: BON domain-containing protein [Pirellulales bacterium]|jgi:hypothetical protein|nr:BON domain-containing protein [Pirellulales bacterium]
MSTIISNSGISNSSNFRFDYRSGDEAEIARRAESHLHGSGYTDLRRVRCTYAAGVLSLHGTLPSFYLRQVAESLATNLPEVDQIDSQLLVA